jgi:hypothetical protein
MHYVNDISLVPKMGQIIKVQRPLSSDFISGLCVIFEAAFTIVLLGYYCTNTIRLVIYLYYHITPQDSSLMSSNISRQNKVVMIKLNSLSELRVSFISEVFIYIW